VGRHLAMAAIAMGVFLGPPIPPAASQDAEKSGRWSAWTGITGGLDYVYAYVGTGAFLIGNADTGGLIARLSTGGGGYRTADDHQNYVVQYDASLLLGYRAEFDGPTLAILAGGDVSRHDNRDPDATPRGTEWGAKGLIEAYVPVGSAFYLAGYGTYSTAFDTFSADTKLAYRLTETFALGPEAGAVGSVGFAQARAGLATSWKLDDRTELAGAAGAGWDLDDSDLGFYGLLNLYTEF